MNVAGGNGSLVVGGEGNVTCSDCSVIVGGSGNTAQQQQTPVIQQS